MFLNLRRRKDWNNQLEFLVNFFKVWIKSFNFIIFQYFSMLFNLGIVYVLYQRERILLLKSTLKAFGIVTESNIHITKD